MANSKKIQVKIPVLVERLAQIDQSPFNGHWHCGNVIKEGKDWRPMYVRRGATAAGGPGAGAVYSKIMS